ncbi:GNAT family N-acetyltransferase [Trichocoleus sp. FACHB-262]|uniref:GNAT family N-acetyltransferase n=1 Tax=Trichocoleus sp. FACHB-262 TaxID=2692869 RepID=UPI001688F994|nr:GNAT family N-acetyltransferase [Trichocoleus sp. FACHB-262]MBD2123631.1 GNAT family N-acetyltransferase [Trichocoleus sp. FACHB-262]
MLQPDLFIRLAMSEDAAAIAPLAEQLGYFSSPRAVQERLKRLEGDRNHAVYIAHSSSVSAVGWVHVYARESLLVGRVAEIGGLIVHQNYRGQRIGRLLLQHAEQWAQKQNCSRMVVRSNTQRQAAHQFYKNVSYQSCKTQLVFDKALLEVTDRRSQSSRTVGISAGE